MYQVQFLFNKADGFLVMDSNGMFAIEGISKQPICSGSGDIW